MEYALKEPRLLLRDDAHPVPDSFLTSYFDDLRQVLHRRLDEFRHLPRRLTPAEEKELRFMVEEIIRAKNNSVIEPHP